MSDAYRKARRETLQGLLETAAMLVASCVEDGEPLEDVADWLGALRQMLAGKDPP